MAFTNVREVFKHMPETFDPSVAQGLEAVIQYDINGEGGGSGILR